MKFDLGDCVTIDGSGDTYRVKGIYPHKLELILEGPHPAESERVVPMGDVIEHLGRDIDQPLGLPHWL